MAGEGFVFNMISSLRGNKALRSNKDYFLRKRDYLKAAKTKNIDVKKATPEELKKIREELIAYNKEQNTKKIIGLLLAAVIAPLILWALIAFGQWMFSDAKEIKLLKKETIDRIRSGG